MREALHQWATSRLGATGDFDVLPLIGSKEFVAWLPTFLEAKTVLIPDIAYPTYKVGAILASAQAVAVDISPKDWPEADFAWVNSPSNPTGRVHTDYELRAVIEWSRTNKALIVSDECYLEFEDTATPTSIMSHTNGDNTNILAVHSLSKRSNMAGYRAAFVVGDTQVIARLREVRKHAGMIVPLPVQQAMIAALSDDEHVVQQRARYNSRRETLASPLKALGFRIEESKAGLYIWCTRDESDWDSVSFLADCGVLVTPGSFYGEKGAHYIRVALTATDENISKACDRLIELKGKS